MHLPATIRALAFRGLPCILAAVLTASPQVGEKRNSTPDELYDLATHVVLGEVSQLSVSRSLKVPWEVRSYTALVEIERVEKAPLDFEAGELEVRYWDRTWHGTASTPPATTGHSPLPSLGASVRVYCTNEGDNGFDTTIDGGFDVLGRNGWEIFEHGPQRDAPFGGAELTSDWRDTAKLVGVGAVAVLLVMWLRMRRARRIMA